MNQFTNKTGLNVSALQKGTKLIVETQNSFYDLEVVEGKLVTIFGGTQRDGTLRFQKPTEVIVYGSTFGGTILKVDWIGINMHLQVREPNSPFALLTTPIKNITIEAPDGSWEYTLS